LHPTREVGFVIPATRGFPYAITVIISILELQQPEITELSIQATIANSMQRRLASEGVRSTTQGKSEPAGLFRPLSRRSSGP
jgi:hypothetical protein